MKFKVGDKVIVIHAEVDEEYYRNGDYGNIVHVHEEGFYYVEFEHQSESKKDQNSWAVMEDQLDFDYLHNTPLRKVLEEK